MRKRLYLFPDSVMVGSMKLSSSIFFAVWAGSLVGAYYFGQSSARSGQTPESVSTAPIAQARSIQSTIDEGGMGESSAIANDALANAEVSRSAPDAFALLLGGETSRETWMKATLEALSYDSHQLETALAQLQSLPSTRDRNQMMQELLKQWGQIDPVRALAFADDIESLQERNRAIGEVLEGWAAKDPVSALKWLEDESPNLAARLYGDHMDNIMEGFAAANPVAALQYAQTLAENSMAERRVKRRAMREVVDAMVEQNRIAEAIDMTLAMKESSNRNETLEEIVDQWAAVDPLAAKAFVESMTDDPAFGDLQRELLGQWAQIDPPAAAEWISELDPADPNLPRLATSLVERWTRYDINAAADWLNTVPASPEMDRAVAIFSMRAAQDDPEVALTSWVPSISDPQLQERLTRGIAPLLKEQDPEAFEAFLAHSDYTDEQKEGLRNAPARYGRGTWR